MSSIESGACTWAEYRAGEEERLHDAEIAVEGLYVVMFAMRNPDPYPAIKFPCRLMDIEFRDGVADIQMGVLISKDKTANCYAVLNDGFLADLNGTEISHKVIKSGYFKEDYEDTVFGRDIHEMIKLTKQDEMTDQPMVPRVPTLV